MNSGALLCTMSLEEAKASTGLSRSEVFTLIFDIGQRITFAEVIENEWFKKGYKEPKFENADVSLDDVDAIFDESGVRLTFFFFPLLFVCFLYGLYLG